jgi:DNA repair exonuclease SbcCD ATPase subunit
MIREIPLTPSKSASTSDLLKHDRKKSRERGGTIGFAESRGPEAKGEQIDRNDEDDETNPVEWIMITRSDPGGGIPRFMVERNTPSSIVTDAGKFLNWACAKDDFPSREETEELAEDSARKSLEGERKFSISESNGISAGIGSSIADRPTTFRTHSQHKAERSIIDSIAETVGGYIPETVEAYIPNALNPLQRTDSLSSTSTTSSSDSFASADEGPSPAPSISSVKSTSESTSLAPKNLDLTQNNHHTRELQRIESKKAALENKLEAAREKNSNPDLKTSKDLEKAAERHARAQKKQEAKFAREVQKLEERRKRETQKLLQRQQKEADKSNLQKLTRERDEWKQKAELMEKENKVLHEQIGDLQRENTALVARIGKTPAGVDMLKKVREELEGNGGRKRASSRASADSKASGRKSEHLEASNLGTTKQVEPWKGVEGGL